MRGLTSPDIASDVCFVCALCMTCARAAAQRKQPIEACNGRLLTTGTCEECVHTRSLDKLGRRENRPLRVAQASGGAYLRGLPAPVAAVVGSEC
jgi:hypothetical protein